MKKVRGIGINDTELSGPACTKRDNLGKKSNYLDYQIWYGMLVRATDEEYKAVTPAYSQASVSEDWLIRSNFKKWYMAHSVFFDLEGLRLELDKDLLVPGNKMYSADTCALIPQYLNVAFNSGVDSATNLPMWVSYRKRNKDMLNDLKKPYRASLTRGNGEFVHVGYFSEVKDAHQAAQQMKISFLYEILDKYSKEPCFRQDVFEAVLLRIQKIEKQLSSGEYTFKL